MTGSTVENTTSRLNELAITDTLGGPRDAGLFLSCPGVPVENLERRMENVEINMLFYWSYSSIPELARLPKAKRTEIQRECWKKAYRHWQAWAAVALVLLAPALGVYAFHEFMPPPYQAIGSIFLTCLGFFSGIFANHFVIRAAIPYVRQCVGGICPDCGYDVRATPARCPECGRQLAHTVCRLGQDLPAPSNH